MLTSLISLNCCGQYFVSVYLFDSFLVFMLQAALEYFFLFRGHVLGLSCVASSQILCSAYGKIFDSMPSKINSCH